MQPIPPVEPAGVEVLPVCLAGHLGADFLQGLSAQKPAVLQIGEGVRIESVLSRGSSLFKDAVVKVMVSGTAGRSTVWWMHRQGRKIDYERMIAVREHTLRIVFFHRRVSDGFQMF